MSPTLDAQSPHAQGYELGHSHNTGWKRSAESVCAKVPIAAGEAQGFSTLKKMIMRIAHKKVMELRLPSCSGILPVSELEYKTSEVME